MIRTLATALAIAIAVSGVLALRLRPPEMAHACSLAPADFERDTQAAAFVALVEAVEVSGAANEQRRLPSPTPSPTYQPPVTDAPLATATRTPRGAKTATPTETAFPTWTPVTAPTPELLVGIGATLEIVTLYAGEAVSPIIIDAYGRARFEQYLREREALLPIRTSCDGMHPPAYAQGARYLVFGTGDGVAFATNMRIPVDGDDVVVQPGEIVLRQAEYHRYFDGMPADLAEGYAVLRAGRVPLASFAHAIVASRRGLIAPPDTGSAGLASRR